jgi:hypothetical protein
MSDWNEVEGLQASMLRSLREGENYDLPLRDRRKLWLAFGEYQRQPEPPYAVISIGLRRRFDLELGCVLKALPLWEVHYPREMIVEPIVLARDYLRGGATADQLSAYASGMWADFDDFVDEDSTATTMLCFAAVKLLSVALDDSFVHPDIINDNKEDTQYEIHSREIGYNVSRIIAGTFSPKGATAFSAIRAFWEWYLVEAVPKAWALGYQEDLPQSSS